jgi:hypothetical protein
MTHSARLLTARAVLDQLMASVGVDGLVAAMSTPGVLAVVDQHAAAIRETLRAAGRELDTLSLAGYARSVLAGLHRCGLSLPDAESVDWPHADGLVLRLVAVCLLAETHGCL